MQSLILNMFLKLQMLFCGKLSAFLDDGFEGLARENIVEILDTSAFTKPLDALFLIVTSDGQASAGTYSALWSTVSTTVNSIIMPIGISLTVTYFIMSLIDMASKDNTTLEHYIKEFVKLIIAITVVKNSWPIMLYLLKISEMILLDLKTTDEISLEDARNQIEDILKSNSGSGWLSSWFTSLIPKIVKQIAVIAMYVCVFMRALDIAWRAAMFPIGAANLFDNGINSSGVKYIKSFFGALLSGAMIMLIMSISPSIATAAYDIGVGNDHSYVTGMFAIAGAELAIVGAAFGASNKVREAFS